ncbi:histidine kinase [Sphingobacterium sp. DR205]|uniref:sensor histidine kinase n=1 Tax=Sphingobacterium sp. DR205 TaxID=2713573 RepID=UPI0013E4BCF5|nr:histidine kinase [Sphingobacterium sp. DR205]QIH32694.1 hypothetical protein G6053_07205 [Sphingobacterium sp. DR205]
MARIVVFIYLLLTAFIAFAQERLPQRIYNFSHFTSREGLPSDKIRDAATDPDGLLWMATARGLCYFDGKTFHPVSFDQKGDFSYDLSSISIGEGNKIWVTSYNRGLLCYDRSKPSDLAWTKYAASVNQGALVKHELYAVHESAGKVYFGGQETDLQMLDLASGHITVIKLDRKACMTIFRIHKDRQGLLWIGTRYHGLFSYDPGSKKIVHYGLANLGENAVTAVCDVGGKIFASYYNYNLIHVDPALREIKQKDVLGLGPNVSLYDNNIDEAAFFPEENIVLAAHRNGKLYRYGLQDKHIEEVDWNLNVPDGSGKPNRINRIVPVRRGYFICSDNGLYYYSKEINQITDFISGGQQPIHRLIKVNDSIWYLTAGGIGQLSADFRTRISVFPLAKLSVSQLMALDGRIYISTLDRGIFVFDTTKKTLGPLKVVGSSFGLEHADCNRIVADTVGGRPVLWIGSWSDGLYRYDMQANSVVRYDKTNGLIDHKIITLAKDAAGALWMGMDGFGAVKVEDKLGMKFIHFKHGKSPTSLAVNTVFSFLLDADRNFWYSSSQQGIGQITGSAANVRFRQVNDRNRFPRIYAYALKDDFKGRIWMRTPDGMTIFDPGYSTFDQLDPGQGVVPPDRFHIYDFYQDSDNLVWTTDKGLIKGSIKALNDNRREIKPIISAFKILNRDNSYRLRTGRILLQPRENTFSFLFSAAEIMNGKNLRFSYKLEGIDRDWIDAEDRHEAVYSNVPGGNYRFFLRVEDQNGKWSTHQLVIPLSVKLLWYQGLWFKIGLIACIFLAVILILLYGIAHQKKINRLQHEFSLTLQQELKQNEIKIREQAEVLEVEKEKKLASEFRQKLYESELKAIRSQMNPHFIFNILNSIEAYVVENDARHASKLIHKFATLSRLVLENSQFSMASIASELQLVKLYLELEQERFGQTFDYVIHVDEDLIKSSYRIPSMLIQPLVENAVHHGVRHLSGRRGKISIKATKKDNNLCIEIMDNGVGFDFAPKPNLNPFKSASFGIMGVEDRLRMINSEKLPNSAWLEIDKNPQEEDFTVKVSMMLPLLKNVQ